VTRSKKKEREIATYDTRCLSSHRTYHLLETPAFTSIKGGKGVLRIKGDIVCLTLIGSNNTAPPAKCNPPSPSAHHLGSGNRFFAAGIEAHATLIPLQQNRDHNTVRERWGRAMSLALATAWTSRMKNPVLRLQTRRIPLLRGLYDLPSLQYAANRVHGA
jgi:hypothetical protein